METIRIRSTDDRYTVRETLRRVDDKQVLVTLPWETDRGWQSPLDFEVQRRVGETQHLDMAWVVEDPARRAAAKKAGLPVFHSEASALRHLAQHASFPAIKTSPRPERPKRPWWSPIPRRAKAPSLRHPPAWLLTLEGAVLIVVLAIVAAAFFLAVPSAEIVLHPASVSYSRIISISVDPTAEQIDLQRSVIPSQRIGDEFEGYAEVVTSGRGYAFSGRATGSVLLTNLLGQDYQVPEGTVVRTSAGSYPVRFETTADVTVPAFGQAEAPIEALTEGPSGNVDAYQINLVEGVAGFAVRVTNPAPISGAQSNTVRTVSEEDRSRAWDLAAEQVLAEAYNGLQELAAAEAGRFLPRQSLAIQAAPKAAYTHLVGEQSDTLGLSLRLLVTGEAVHARDVQAVAYQQLVTQLPDGYTLTDARFEYGEAAEEDIGPGAFTFYVKAHGFATAKIDTGVVQETVRGTPVEEAEAQLAASLPLSRPPEITVSPTWFPYLPFVPIKTQIDVIPGTMMP
ncbi:MAG: baseplate J/gp47 family protein [Anaerolineae bacterium]|nr:baseplate J/gp47 family protein [Anaerolineae bacterium]